MWTGAPSATHGAPPGAPTTPQDGPATGGRTFQGTGTRADPLVADSEAEVAELRQRHPRGTYVLYKG